MVSSSYIDIHSLTLEELAGLVNLYPWFGGARVELGRRMSRLGADSWGEEQFADSALHVQNRSIIFRLASGTTKADYADKDLGALLASFMEPAKEAESQHQVRVVGGDYFSQAQYDKVKEKEDNIFSRFAAKSPSSAEADGSEGSEMAERFATETLARIFAEQGRVEEAKRIYSRLILEFPEKSAYFATLIDSLT